MGIFKKNADKRQSVKSSLPVPEPVHDGGVIPEEIIVVISAAVAALTGGEGTMRSIRESRSTKGARPVWSMAGLLESTRPF